MKTWDGYSSVAQTYADLFAMLPLVRRVDAATLEFSSPTMRHAVRVLNSLSAMSFMLR